MNWELYIIIIYGCIIILLCMVICYIGHEKKLKINIFNNHKIKPVDI